MNMQTFSFNLNISVGAKHWNDLNAKVVSFCPSGTKKCLVEYRRNKQNLLFQIIVTSKIMLLYIQSKVCVGVIDRHAPQRISPECQNNLHPSRRPDTQLVHLKG